MTDNNMDKKLKALFGYQEFSRNRRIDKMMQEAEKAFPRMLSDDELFSVNAAGEMTDAGTDTNKLNDSFPL